MRAYLAAVGGFVFLTVVLLPTLLVLPQGTTPPEPPTLASVPRLEVCVFRTATGQLVRVELEEYVLGVLGTEMPANFAMEALKAQAVAARTYACRRLRYFGGQGCERHPQADVCDDPNHCQGWLPTQALLDRWPSHEAARNLSRLAEAVAATRGLILTYRGLIIDPVYHSTCGGHTADSSSVWGRAEPYLVGVPCAWDRHSPHYRTERRFRYQELAALLGEPAVPVWASSDTTPALAADRSGRLMFLRWGDRTWSGTQLRQLLELPSTRLVWRAEEDGVVIITYGSGHGVGLCQYGADGLARAGYDFRQILQYYYQGVQVVPLFGE